MFPDGLKECLRDANQIGRTFAMAAIEAPGARERALAYALGPDAGSGGFTGHYNHLIWGHGHGAGPLVGVGTRRGCCRGGRLIRPSMWCITIEIRPTPHSPSGDTQAWSAASRREEPYLGRAGEPPLGLSAGSKEHFHLVW